MAWAQQTNIFLDQPKLLHQLIYNIFKSVSYCALMLPLLGQSQLLYSTFCIIIIFFFL